MIVLLFLLSVLGGFLSGLLGLGGAVVMIPLMLTIPPVFGFGELSMKAVAGLSMIQVLFASFSGMIAHRKNRSVHFPALIYIGIPMGFSALAGSYASKYFQNIVLMYVFTGIVSLAFFTFLFDRKLKSEAGPVENISINKVQCIIAGAVTGAVSGMVGVGGGFILMPFMTYFQKIPLKITMGTSLGIIFIGAVAGAIGKIASLQVDLILVIPVILGSVIAAQFGAKINKMTSPAVLRYILMIVIFLSIVQMIFKIAGV